MTRAQENVVEQLSLKHGRVCVSRPFSDGSVEATAPGGASIRIAEEGHVTKRPPNHSIDWVVREEVVRCS